MTQMMPPIRRGVAPMAKAPVIYHRPNETAGGWNSPDVPTGIVTAKAVE